MNRIQPDRFQSLSEEVERVLLGACLRFPENVPVIIGRLEAEDFSSPRNRDIFSTIKSLYEKKAPVELVSVSNELKVQAKEIPAYKVAELVDEFIDGFDLDYYVTQLKTFSKRRRLELTLENTLIKLQDPSIEYSEAEERIIQEITAIVNDGSVTTRKRQGIDLTFTTLEEVLQYEEPQYLIKPIIIEGTVNLFGGGAGKGKSLVTLSIIKSIVTGEPLWKKYPVVTTGPVLLVDEETSRPFLRNRIERMRFEKPLPIYFLHFQDVRLDRDDTFDALVRKIEEVSPVLIVFDSLIRFHRQPESDSVLMASVMGRLRKIANTGPTVWVIHHHRKGDGPLEQKARGSSDIVAGVDVEYGILVKDDFLNFSSVKTRVEPFGPIRLKLEVTDDRIDVVYKGTERENILQEVGEILSIKERLGVDGIHDELKNRGVEVGINKLREILRSAKELGSQKVRTGRSRKFVYFLKDSCNR